VEFGLGVGRTGVGKKTQGHYHENCHNAFATHNRLRRKFDMKAEVTLVLYFRRTGRLVSTVQNGNSKQQTEGIRKFETDD
jgi:hypothetical protein